jgi:hypothetical protein
MTDHSEFWQFEQGFDKLKVHEQGSSFWIVRLFQYFARDSSYVNRRPKSPIFNPTCQPQTWQRAKNGRKKKKA